MRTTPIGIVTLLALLIEVSPVLAQRRAPDTGMVGVGVSVGVDIPSAPALDKGLDLAANIKAT